MTTAPTHSMWDRPDLRKALAARDIAALYRILQKFGYSQRRIAALTGQSQSEISEILGGRRVVAYDVLVRIADGLRIWRGRMGLAYDVETAALVDESMPEKRPRRQPPSWWAYEAVNGDA